MTEGERIRLLVERYYRGNQHRFALAAGLKDDVVSRLIKGEFHLNKDRISRILTACPSCSEGWLTEGIGSNGVESSLDDATKRIAELEALVEDQRLTIEALRKAVDALTRQ